MKNTTRRVLLLAVVFFLGGVGALQAEFPTAGIDKYLDACAARGEFNGVVLLARKGEVQYHRALGKASVDGGVRAILAAARPDGRLDANTCDYDRRTALHLASAEGWIVLVRALVEEFGADTSPVDRWGGTPLDDAVRSGHEGVVRYLRSKGAKRGAQGAVSSSSLAEGGARAAADSAARVLFEGQHVELFGTDTVWRRHVLMSPLSDERWRAWEVAGTWPTVVVARFARADYDRGPMEREPGLSWRTLEVDEADEPTYKDETSGFKYRIVGGVRLPFFASQRAWRTLREGYAPRARDTFVTGYFRNGRTLAQLMTLLLHAEAEAEADGADLVDLDMSKPYVLEFAFTRGRLNLRQLEARPRRDRVFKSGMRPSSLPCVLPAQPDAGAAAAAEADDRARPARPVRLPGGAKFVHVMRDPRDAAVSAFEFWNKTIKPGWSFGEFAGYYMRGQLCFEQRVDHDLEWWATAQAHPEQVHWVCYEDLVRSPEAQVRSLAAFLELGVSDAAVRRVAAATRLDEAKRRYLSHEGMGMMLKRGEAGVYREYFDGVDDENETLARFDAALVEPLRRAGVHMVLN